MKILLLCVILATGQVALSKPSSQSSPNSNALSLFTRVFSLPNLAGNYLDIYEYVPDLFDSGINDDIDSVYQTGMWMYYEQSLYNTEYPGRVYFVHGIELSVTFPVDYMNMMSSVRFVGNNQLANDDTWTLFEEDYFCGREFYGVTDASYLDYLDLQASSLVVTGYSAWTLYSGQSFTGDSFCVYPDTDHDVGPQGDTLDFGIYPTMSILGLPDNSIRSVAKGCFSDKTVKLTKPINYQHKSKNGAWGYMDLSEDN